MILVSLAQGWASPVVIWLDKLGIQPSCIRSPASLTNDPPIPSPRVQVKPFRTCASRAWGVVVMPKYQIRYWWLESHPTIRKVNPFGSTSPSILTSPTTKFLNERLVVHHKRIPLLRGNLAHWWFWQLANQSARLITSLPSISPRLKACPDRDTWSFNDTVH